MRHERSMLPERYGTNEDDIVDKLNVFPHRGPSKPCRSSFVKGRRSWVDRASPKLVEAGSIEPCRRPSRPGRSSLIEARRSWVDRASSKLVEAGSIEPRRSSSRLGRSSLAGARRGWVGRASSKLVEAGSVGRPDRARTPEAGSSGLRDVGQHRYGYLDVVNEYL